METVIYRAKLLDSELMKNGERYSVECLASLAEQMKEKAMAETTKNKTIITAGGSTVRKRDIVAFGPITKYGIIRAKKDQWHFFFTAVDGFKYEIYGTEEYVMSVRREILEELNK